MKKLLVNSPLRRFAPALPEGEPLAGRASLRVVAALRLLSSWALSSLAAAAGLRSIEERCCGEKPLSLLRRQLPRTALLHNKPLSQSLSALPAPLNRGATGVPVLVLLDELSFSKP